jgi:hypothetical protein
MMLTWCATAALKKIFQTVLGRIIAMSTSAADLIGTCACAQEVQFKRILAADLFFWQYAPTQ